MNGTFLDILNGLPRQIWAIVTSTGAGDANSLIRLGPTGRLSTTFMPVGIGADTQTVLTSETLAAGDLVHIWDNAGTPNVRRADATAINKFTAVGFVLDNVTSGQNALVYLEGRLTGLTGLAIGAYHYLSETPGQITQTAPVTPESIVQGIGIAVDANTISFERSLTIEMAPAEV